MLRVINQELGEQQAWDLWTAGAGKKGEPFHKYTRRVGMEARTRPDAEEAQVEHRRTIRDVKRRLGAFYKPPAITA